MPFGLCTTPQLFTILTHAITHFCHQRGICIILYFDDTIMAHSHTKISEYQDFVMALMHHLGFLINLEKSDLSPAQCFTFLGLCWDTTCLSVAFMEEKVTKIQSLGIVSLGDKAEPPCRKIQHFLGRTNFAASMVLCARLNLLHSSLFVCSS